MRYLSFFMFIALTWTVFIGCEKISSPKENDLELEQVVKDQASFGWQVNRMISSSNDIEGLTQNSQYFEEDDADELPKVAGLKRQAMLLTAKAGDHLPKTMVLMKSSGDSLIYFEETYFGERGRRVAVYYNSETGKARIYETFFQFPNWRNIVYDSTEVVFDLNYTLYDNTDDRVERLYKIQNFKEHFFVQSIISQLQVTDYDGNEITGGIVTKDAYYHENRNLSHLRQNIELYPDNSGTLREDFEFRDGSTAYTSVTFNSDNTGTFIKKRRDGTMISGEFNSIEDDLHGFYTETVDFPEGRYIDKIIKSAIVSVTLPDSIFNADFSEFVYFSSGRIDSTSAIIQIQEVSGVKTTTLALNKRNGAYGTFTIIESESESTIEGTWTTWDGYYIILNAEYYIDGSAHLYYEVYAPPYNPGDDPIIIADYYFSPDQTGSGTIAHNGNMYQINFVDSGQASISFDGKSESINLFE